FMAIGISETSGLHVRLHYGDRKLVNANSEKYQPQVEELRERWVPEKCPPRHCRARRRHARSTTFDGYSAAMTGSMPAPPWPSSARFDNASQRCSGVTTEWNKRAAIGRRGSPNRDLRLRSTATMGMISYNRRLRKQQVRSLMQGGGGGGGAGCHSRRASSLGLAHNGAM
ncbi:hypothetical protein FOZ63_021402, partial [Perkinsus olseni]